MNNRFSRQSFLGPNSDVILGQCTVAVVGLGGGGSHVAQQLAYAGISSFLLYDGDEVETSNMNRLIGASAEDAHLKTPKVVVAERCIRSVRPEATLQAHQGKWQTAGESIREADVIVSCVDSYSARQDLEVTGRRYLIPLVDIGMDVFLVDGKPHVAGQVILSLPPGPCLKCLGFLSEENLQREAEQYGTAGGRPQVVWSNGVLASVAVGIVVDLLTGWNGVNPKGEYLHFDGNTNGMWRSPRLEYAPLLCPHFAEGSVGDPVFE
jgi:molybdopterin-synthase adenylyltransferase